MRVLPDLLRYQQLIDGQPTQPVQVHVVGQVLARDDRGGLRVAAAKFWSERVLRALQAQGCLI